MAPLPGGTFQASARPTRWRFFSSVPGSTVKCTCPSSSTAITRTTALPKRLPATSITPRPHLSSITGIAQARPAEPVIVLSVEVSYQVDLRLHRASLQIRLPVVIRVGHDLMPTASEYLHALTQVIKANRVMPRIPPGGL